ncbi:MAG: hypothetical protein QXP36_10360 [Conexivisphaerales archaeon]
MKNETSDNNDNFEAFIPDFCLQGEILPFYILWKSGKLKDIIISYGPGLNPKSLNNVPPTEIKLDRGQIKISQTEVEGYLSGSFEAILDKTCFEKREFLNISVELESETKNISKEILLFRPDIKAYEVPKEIILKVRKDKKIVPSDTIKLANHGLGTAVIFLDKSEDTKAEVVLPPSWENMIKNLYDDMDSALQKVADKYPQFKELLPNYLSLLKAPFLSKKSLIPYRETINKLENLMNENEEFAKELVSSIFGAVVRNLSLTRNLQEFVNYLMSIKPSRVLLTNPFTEMKIPKGVSAVGLNINITDLAWNDYEIIETGLLQIVCDEDITIRISDLVSFEGEKRNESIR